MSGRGAEQRLGHADPPFPPAIGQIGDRLRPLFLRRPLRIDQQNPRPGGQAVPEAVFRAIHLRIAGGDFRAVDIQQPQAGQAQSEDDLVIPKDIASRTRGLGNDRVGQAGRLGRFRIEFRQDGDAGGLGKVFEDRLGELFVQGRIDNHFRPVGGPAAGEEEKKKERKVERVRKVRRVSEVACETV